MKTLLLFAAAGLAFAAGCNNGNAPADLTSVVKADVGGSVYYAFDTEEPLEAVTVTLTDIDGDEHVTTTNAGGLWSLSNLAPGMYTERFEKAGFEPQLGTFALDAFGENDVENIFIDHFDVYLPEAEIVATVSGPFAVTLRSGDDPVDGFGSAMEYSVAQDGSITATFDRLIIDGDFYLYDEQSGDFAFGNRDDASGVTVFTIDEADIDAMDGGLGLTTDSDPMTWIELIVFADAYTPLHGDAVSMFAIAQFSAVP